MKPMADLIPYGIDDEQTDVRVHVCVVARRIYVFATKEARELLNNRAYPKVPAFQDGRQTATGYLVPPKDIPGCRQFELPDLYWQTYPIRREMPTSEKGDRATQLVKLGLSGARIALPLQSRLIEDFNLQIEGVDIIAHLDARIQVKCDFDGGSKAYGGTGNLFIQIAEANPNKHY